MAGRRAGSPASVPLAVAPDAIRNEELWADPDVRWLAGVNLAAGVTYFNKQQFEELLTWLQLPMLIEIAQLENFLANSEQSGGIAAEIVVSSRPPSPLLARPHNVQATT